MAKTTAERQANYRRRMQARLNQCVTPEDVHRAARLMFEHEAQFPENRLPSWDDWVASCQTKRGRDHWAEVIPSSGDLDMYVDDFSEEDAALLAKVGAVFEAMKTPPRT